MSGRCAFCGRTETPGHALVDRAALGALVCSETCGWKWCARDTNGTHHPDAGGTCTACGKPPVLFKHDLPRSTS